MNGVWAAFAGDTITARRHLAALHARPVEERGPTWRTGTLLEAAIPVVRNDWDEVVRALGEAAFEGGGVGLFGDLGMRRWLVAEGYQRLGRLDSAVAYLEMLVTPTRTTWQDELTKGLTFSFAEFRLGKLYTQWGDYKRARRHYGIFLDTFTRPDTEYQWMVTEARQALVEAERRGG